MDKSGLLLLLLLVVALVVAASTVDALNAPSRKNGIQNGNVKRSSTKLGVSPMQRKSGSDSALNGYDLHPLLAIGLPSEHWYTDCAGYDVVMYRGNESDPVVSLFTLPFPNSGLLEDGLVGLDETNQMAYTWVSALRKKGQAGYEGGFLLGMLAQVTKSGGELYPYGGIYSAPLINDFVPYSLTVVGNTIWAWADTPRGSFLTKIDPGTGNVTEVIRIPKDHELASPLPTVLDNNGILHTMTFDVTTKVFGYVYRVNLNTLEVLPTIRINITDPITDCTEWLYDPTTGTTYTLCYDKAGKGSFIGTIDLNTYQVQYIGSEPLIPVPYLYSSGTFTVNYKEGAAFVIQDSPHLEDTWLVKANLTTGERMSEMTLLGTDAMFLTYLPWVE